jgi:hypothetical protein
MQQSSIFSEKIVSLPDFLLQELTSTRVEQVLRILVAEICKQNLGYSE